MQESEYLDVRVNKKTRLPLLFKEIFSTRKKNIRLIIEEPLDWMRNETQMRFLKHKIEEQGKKIVIVTDDPEVRAVAQNASIQVQINALSPEQQTSNMLEISKDKQVVKKQPTASASVVISKKDKSEPAKDRVVIKSEYELSEKDATGKFSFFPKKGRSHTFTVKKQFASGLLTKIFRKPSQTSKNTDTPTSEKLKTSIIALLQKKKLTTIILAIILVCVLIIFFATSVLPAATIRITPSTHEKSIEYTFIANANISQTDEDSVPAQILEESEEKTYTVVASGVEEVEEYAQGEITIYNETTESQVLVQGTRFASSEGKVFTIVERVRVPAGTRDGGRTQRGSITIQVRAYEPGESYNIGPTKFSIPGFRTTDKYFQFSGESNTPMTGGIKGIRNILTQEDITKITQRAREELFQESETKLRNNIPADVITLEDTLRSDIAFNPTLEIGKPAPQKDGKLSVKATATTRVVFIRENDAKTLFDEHLAVENFYDPEKEEIGDTTTIDYTVLSSNYNTGIVRVTMNVTQSFRSMIDKDALFAEIAGKSTIEARRILSQKQAIQPQSGVLRTWPFWVNKIPSNRKDVKFDIQYID